MHHLDVVASALVTNPVTAGLVVALGRDALEDVLDVGPGSLVTTGHHGGAVTGTLLTTGDTGANKVEALGLEVLSPPVGVGEVRVSTINDDVTGLQEGQECLNPVINSLASLDEEHDTTGLLEGGNELLGGVSANDGLALGLVVEEAVDLGDSSVEGGDGETVVGHVQNQVLTPLSCSASTCHRERADMFGDGATYMTARPIRPRSAL